MKLFQYYYRESQFLETFLSLKKKWVYKITMLCMCVYITSQI